MAAVKFTTFHLNTFANYQKIKAKDIPDKKPDFVSRSGSKYWYVKDKKAVIRQSDHWGRTIATCNWLIDGMAHKGTTQGICKLSYFKPENLSLLKEGKEFLVTKTVLERNGGGRMSIETLKGKFVKATSDYYVFDTFKVGYLTLACVEPYKKPKTASIKPAVR